MNSSRCAACKHLRRRCPSDCIFSPYFPSNNPRRFSYVHKIYGASNVGKILQDLPMNRRAEAADSLYYEAYCRIKDPVHGCTGIITILHQQIYKAERELATIQAGIATLTTDSSHTESHKYQQQVESVASGSTACTPAFFPDQNTPAFFPDQNAAFNPTLCYDLSTWFD